VHFLVASPRLDRNQTLAFSQRTFSLCSVVASFPCRRKFCPSRRCRCCSTSILHVLTSPRSSVTTSFKRPWHVLDDSVSYICNCPKTQPIGDGGRRQGFFLPGPTSCFGTTSVKYHISIKHKPLITFLVTGSNDILFFFTQYCSQERLRHWNLSPSARQVTGNSQAEII
jgi:hypothetical protein